MSCDVIGHGRFLFASSDSFSHLSTVHTLHTTDDRQTDHGYLYNSCYYVQCESKKSPPAVFWKFFPHGWSWEFLISFLHTYYVILSTLDSKFLFKYLQLWQSYAITRSGFYRSDWPSVETLAEDAADVLFRRVLRNENHLLYTLLPDKNSHGYNLRHQRHDRTLVSNHDQRNFIDRQLHKHSY